METSDSECFESADEDFECDRKPTKTQSGAVKISSNLETVTDVAVKLQNVTIKTLKNDNKPNIRDASPTRTSPVECGVEEKIKGRSIPRKEQKEQKTKKESKPKLGTKLGQRIQTKNEKETSNALPRREGCWEPGVNYIEKDQSDKTDVSCVSIPSKREACWEPGMDYMEYNQFDKAEMSCTNIPPKREECWEPDMNYVENDESDKPETSSSNIPQKIERPGVNYVEKGQDKQELFNNSVPPTREGCWEPGVNYIQNASTVTDHKDSKFEEIPSKTDEAEENLWGADDDWETVPNVKVTPQKTPEDANKSPSSGWGSWGNWSGVSNILSTATQGVTTLTSHVSQGITTVLESGIGVPDPEELARLHKNEQKDHDSNAEDTGPTIQTVFGLGNLVSGVSHITRLVETTSNKVLTGGLDTLEVIGKKTMEVLQEGDPGLKKKRAFLKIDQHKPVLSQLLREAKEKAEEENKLLEDRHFQKKANYETLFDDNQGLVHLEALEMLSKQCDIKLETIMSSYSDEQLKEMQETMSQVKELCEIPEDDEEEVLTNDEIKEKLDAAVVDLNVPINYSKLHTIWEESETWLTILNLDLCNERELHQQAIETLAHLTAISVEQYHKAGELLLIKEHRSTADEADSLVQ